MGLNKRLLNWFHLFLFYFFHIWLLENSKLYVVGRYCSWQHCQEGRGKEGSPPRRSHKAPHFQVPSSPQGWSGLGGLLHSMPSLLCLEMLMGLKARRATGNTAHGELRHPTMLVSTSGFLPQNPDPKGSQRRWNREELRMSFPRFGSPSELGCSKHNSTNHQLAPWLLAYWCA